MFKPVYAEVLNTQAFKYILGTDAEAYVLGEVVKFAAGVLTIADVTNAGAQEYVTVKAQAAEATAATPLVVTRIRDTQYFKTTAAGATTKGLVYTLNATADGITTTTTAGVFKVTEVDGTNVIGYFL